MPETERSLEKKGIVVFGALTVFLILLHGPDEIARGAAAQNYASVGVGPAVLFLILLLTLYAFLRFLFHAFTSDPSMSLEAIATGYTSEAIGIFFVFVYMAFGLTSLITFLLTLHTLFVPKKE